MKKMSCLAIILVYISLAIACNEQQPPPAPNTPGNNAVSNSTAQTSTSKSPANAQNLEEAKELYEQKCAMCHGINGKPDDPNTMKATDLTDQQLQREWTDDYLKKVIVKGAGRMAPVESSDAEVDQMIKYMRSLGK
jgi:mono/diheme cytochrome c family protein